MKSIREFLEEDYIKWADRPYISEKRDGLWHSFTFRETIDDIRALSGSLLSLGLKGKNLMLCSENSREWILLYLGIMGYVGTCVPVDKEWTTYDLRHTLSAIPVSAVFYSRSRRERFLPLQAEYPEILWFCIEDSLPELILKGGELSLALPDAKDTAQDALILFTSGTTSMPKAIPLTQENLFANWDTLFGRTPMADDDISYVFLPFHHVYTGVANILYTIISGMQLFLNSDLSCLITELCEVRPTVVCIVPLFLYQIFDALDDTLLDALRHIRFLYCGGSFTKPRIKEYFIRQGVRLLEAYGTTETSSVIALSVPGDPDLSANGVVFENLTVQIIDPDESGTGEIVVSGGSVSRGYLNRADNYSEFDRDGRYHTGDLGYLAPDGHLYLKGRKKRMILTANGKNIYVDELEGLFLANPQIEAAVVFEENHHPAVSVVGSLSEKQALKYLEQINRNLPPYKRIRKLYLKPDIPGGRIK